GRWSVELEKRVVDPKPKLIVEVREAKFVSTRATYGSFRRRRHGGPFTEVAKRLFVTPRERRGAGGHINRTAKMHASLDQVEQHFARVALHFHIGIDREIADPVAAEHPLLSSPILVDDAIVVRVIVRDQLATRQLNPLGKPIGKQ